MKGFLLVALVVLTWSLVLLPLAIWFDYREFIEPLCYSAGFAGIGCAFALYELLREPIPELRLPRLG